MKMQVDLNLHNLLAFLKINHITIKNNIGQ